MLQSVLSKFFGTKHERDIKKIQPLVDLVNSLEPTIKALSDEKLQAKTEEFKDRLAHGETMDDLLPEAYAVVREAAVRVLGQRHYDVQIIGAIVLHQGKIAEMKTGEGKTLASTMPAYLNALGGEGVHIVTPNYYLAYRDSEWMGAIFRFLGLSVGLILNNMRVEGGKLIPEEMSAEEKQEAYKADIAYGVNDAFGFDYLRDNLVTRKEMRVQRALNYAIVDEVDFILIDEARTPLIISDRPQRSAELYYTINRVIPRLKRDEDYQIDEKDSSRGTVVLTEDGIASVERLLSAEHLLKGGSLYDMQNISLVHQVEQALAAHTLYKRDVDYVVTDGKVIIVDEFTGRMQPGRRWSDGLHQAVEAKERVRIEEENISTARITYQNYFRLYKKLAGMTGTAATEAAEFAEIYKLDVVSIPTNKPMIREDNPDKIYRTEKEKFDAIIEEIMGMNTKGRPVLVGTRSIETSERLSDLLRRKNVTHQVLNARHHDEEADIISQAGKPKAVTIATNMAGRGVDIILAGQLLFSTGFKFQDDILFSTSSEFQSELLFSTDLKFQNGLLFSADLKFKGDLFFDTDLRLRRELLFSTNSRFQGDLLFSVNWKLQYDLLFNIELNFQNKSDNEVIEELATDKNRNRGSSISNDLDDEITSEELLQDFEKNKIPLSNKAAVSVENAGSRWLITDGQQEYLIKKDRDRLNVYEGDMDSQYVSKGLRQEFERSEFPLSNEAAVSIEIKGYRWQITDGQHEYLIKKDADRLNVYKGDLDRRNIPEGLRREFERNGIKFSEEAAVSVEDMGNRWLINDVVNDKQRKYLIRRDEDRLDVYKSDLDGRSIPEELRQEFEKRGAPLSNEANVSVEIRGRRWLVTDNQQKFLLTVGWEKEGDRLKIYKDGDLDSQHISEGLRQEFEKVKLPLPEKATVSVESRESKWQINDDKREYLVIFNKEDDKLNVYDESKSLDKKNISEGLRQEFKRSGIPLSENVTVSIKSMGNRWLINDGRREYSIKRDADRLNVYRSDLDARRIPDGLCREFSKNKFQLSNEAAVSVESAGSRWLINDGQQEYLIKKDRDKLDVYEGDLDSRYISKGLRQEFEKNGFPLSDKAAVSVEIRGSRWQITDGQRIYLIIKSIIRDKKKDRKGVAEGRNLLEVYLDRFVDSTGDIKLEDDVRNLGGLHVLGTERHESRRIDDQLRGRSGRQGDPGSSCFILSLEDELMRKFGYERLSKPMEWFGVKDGIPIEHPRITKAIVNSQRRVESHNLEYRKHILKYDDVRNIQRALIYEERSKVLDGEDLKGEIVSMIEEVVDNRLDMYVGEDIDRSDQNVQGLIDWLRQTFLLDISSWDPKPESLSYDEIREKLIKALLDLYEDREQQMGSERMRDIERYVMLDRIDEHWVEHIYNMDYMEEGIGLQAYGQKDPLIEFKREAYSMFEDMKQKIKEEVVEYIFRVPLKGESESRYLTPKRITRRGKSPQPTVAATAAVSADQSSVSVVAKIGRNDPCPCGSGKKYKKCCGR